MPGTHSTRLLERAERGCECVSPVLGGASYANDGPMDIAELQVQARRIRETYAKTMQDIADHLESLDADQPLD